MSKMADYDRDFYSRNFARLLNRALKQGDGDPVRALDWLDHRYKWFWKILFGRHKAEMADAYMDVREHIVKRIEESSRVREQGRKGESE